MAAPEFSTVLVPASLATTQALYGATAVVGRIGFGAKSAEDGQKEETMTGTWPDAIRIFGSADVWNAILRVPRMAQSILELQKNAVLRMLNLGDGGDQSLSTASTWKVLVYDKFCQDMVRMERMERHLFVMSPPCRSFIVLHEQEVVSLLLKVGGLRNHGVTLHLNINSERAELLSVACALASARRPAVRGTDLEQAQVQWIKGHVNYRSVSGVDVQLARIYMRGDNAWSDQPCLLEAYFRHVKMLVAQCPECWSLIYTADDSARAERLEKIRRHLVIEAARGRQVPQDSDERHPWSCVFMELTKDTAYWVEGKKRRRQDRDELQKFRNNVTKGSEGKQEQRQRERRREAFPGLRHLGVYFVEPTEQNIQKIVEDLSKNLYESCYVNFASAVPRPLLEDLANNAFQTGGAQKVAGVFDRYISFVSLSPTLFSLNLPAAYMTLHSTQLEERVMRQYIERIVDGLLSIVATMRVLPVIRCPPGEAAQMIAERLEERIRELLNRSGGVAAELFAAARTGAEVPGGSRSSVQWVHHSAACGPLLIILDRDIDLVTMLSHTWTYQAMVHDVLGMRLNKMQVPVESDDASAPPKARSYDVDDQDSFWTAHAGDQFPEDGAQALAPGLAAAINALPEMTEKKRSIDMHTNIAHALVAEVKARELDRYYELEDQLPSQQSWQSRQSIQLAKGREQLLNASQKGTLADKLRAIMVLAQGSATTPRGLESRSVTAVTSVTDGFVLTKPSISQQQLQGLVDAYENTGGDAAGVRYLQYLQSIRNMAMPSTTSTVTTGGATGTLAGAFGGLADRFMATDLVLHLLLAGSCTAGAVL
eukprot:s2661_g17.t1